MSSPISLSLTEHQVSGMTWRNHVQVQRINRNILFQDSDYFFCLLSLECGLGKRPVSGCQSSTLIYVYFSRAGLQQHDMQAEQLVSHVIRFFPPHTGDDSVRTRAVFRTGNMSIWEQVNGRYDTTCNQHYVIQLIRWNVWLFQSFDRAQANAVVLPSSVTEVNCLLGLQWI